MNKSAVFLKLVKVNEQDRTVEGIATEEQPDRDGEICDIDSSGPLSERFFDERHQATNGKSYGPVRYMHQPEAVGKIIDYQVDRKEKQIRVKAKIVDSDVSRKIDQAVLTGFSIGGRVIRKWRDGDLMRYTADPTEISVVDLPCLPSATFELVKADGSTELRKFSNNNQQGGIMNEQAAKLHARKASAHRSLAKLHRDKADDVNTGRADVKFHKSVADQLDELGRAEEAHAALCRSGLESSDKVAKNFFDNFVYADDDLGCGL